MDDGQINNFYQVFLRIAQALEEGAGGGGAGSGAALADKAEATKRSKEAAVEKNIGEEFAGNIGSQIAGRMKQEFASGLNAIITEMLTPLKDLIGSRYEAYQKTQERGKEYTDANVDISKNPAAMQMWHERAARQAHTRVKNRNYIRANFAPPEISLWQKATNSLLGRIPSEYVGTNYEETFKKMIARQRQLQHNFKINDEYGK